MHRWTRTLLCATLACAPFSPACAEERQAPAAHSTPGTTKETAIEVCRPRGEHDYLSKLACPDGATPSYKRLGNYGERTPLPKGLPAAESRRMFESMMRFNVLQPGEPDHHIVDGYEFVCGADTRIIYLDMYHCADEAPAGNEVSAATCEGEPGCLDKVARYCARRAEHEKDVYAEVFDRARLTYFLENVVGAKVAADYKVKCEED